MLAASPGQPALQAIAAAVADADPLVRLGAVRALEPYSPEIRRQLAVSLLRDPRKAVRIEAARQLATPGALPWSADAAQALRQGTDEWVATELAAAERPETHLNLGALWAEQGKAAAAESELRTALRLDPGFVPALLDLADLYRSQRRDSEAEAPLCEAVRLAPDDADAQYAFGLWLIRQGRRPEAVAPLARATQLRPGDADFARTYGLVVRTVGSGK
jgi:tetratricopeptide (TPR) repeat protein